MCCQPSKSKASGVWSHSWVVQYLPGDQALACAINSLKQKDWRWTIIFVFWQTSLNDTAHKCGFIWWFENYLPQYKERLAKNEDKRLSITALHVHRKLVMNALHSYNSCPGATILMEVPRLGLNPSTTFAGNKPAPKIQQTNKNIAQQLTKKMKETVLKKRKKNPLWVLHLKCYSGNWHKIQCNPD